MNRCVIACALLLAAACDARTSVAGGWCQFPVDCQHPLECSLHRCRIRCATGADCPATNLCLVGHCAVPEDQGCATIPGRECESSLVCAEDHCTISCTTACFGGATCRPATDEAISICVDPNTPIPDAGPAHDAASADAATADAPTANAARDGG